MGGKFGANLANLQTLLNAVRRAQVDDMELFKLFLDATASDE